MNKNTKIYNFLKELGDWYGWQVHLYRNPYQAFDSWAKINYLQKKNYYRNVAYLSRQGYLEKSGKKYAFTDKSLDIFREFKDKNKKIDNQYWHLVSFDIPEKYRLKRDTLRDYLKRNSFIQMHKSIWMSEFDYSNEIKDLILSLKIDKFVKVFRSPKEDFRF